MTDFPGRTGRAGFSLVEIVLAIGVFAFAVVVILGLVSALVNQSGESASETRAAHIAAQIVRDLTPNPSGEGTDVATGNKGILQVGESHEQVPLDGEVPYQETAYYSLDGLPIEKPDSKLGFKADVFLDTVTLEPASGAAGVIPERKMRQVRIEIRPIAQPKSPPFLFVTRLAPQSVEP